MGDAVEVVSLESIRGARERLAKLALGTPLVRLRMARAEPEIYLKLENQQSAGSFKLRPVGNSMLVRSPSSLAAGVHTASSGNSAIAMAWMARRLGVPATAVVPDNAPALKVERLRQLGAHIVSRVFDEWWHDVRAGRLRGVAGIYVDAAREPAALAANGTIGLEILEELADIDAIFTPFGSGALACGIACATRVLKPDVRIIACELETAQPLTAALRAGEPVDVAHECGFVSGVGFGSILPQMWPLVSHLINATVTVSLEEVAAAIRIMAQENRIIAEGAGAIPVAAALSARHRYGKVCAVVSGGNMDQETLVRILGDRRPRESAPGGDAPAI